VLESKIEGPLLTIQPTVARLDASNAAELRERFEEIADPEKLILLDLSNVEMMDSSGLAAIIYCFQMLDIHDELAICSPKPRVMQLFQMTNLGQVVRIYENHEDAIAALTAGKEKRKR